MVRRNLKPAPKKIKQQAYFMLTRPLVEYASCAWDPHTERNTHKIEMVQRRAARFVSNRYHNTSSVTDMLGTLKWPSLQDRRRKSRLVLLYKAINEKTALPTGPEYLPRSRRQTRNSRKGAFIPYSPSTNVFKFSFYPRTLVDWNKLPLEITGSNSVEAFRRGLQRA